jgi:glycosyltransferase involved in cell wall biosynthesis
MNQIGPAAAALRVAVLTGNSIPFGERIRIDGIVGCLRGEGHTVETIAMDPKAALRTPGPGLIGFCLAKLWLLVDRFGLPTTAAMLKGWLTCILAAYAVRPRLRTLGCDILLAETHHSGLCGWLLRSDLGLPLYVDFHGTADEVAARPAYFRQALQVERCLVRESDFVISCSGVMRAHLIAQHGGDPGRHIVCHNGTETREKHARHGLPLRVVYAGVFAYYQRIMDFIEAARLNDDPEIEFYLMGGGGNEAEVLRHIADHKIEIEWLGYKPRAETLDLFTTMQVGVLPTTDDLARQVASPIKLLDYASCGLPVVTVAVGEWSQVLKDYGGGAVCPRCEPELLLAAIRSLKDEARWTQASLNAQRMIREARTWPVVLAPLTAHLRGVKPLVPAG